MVEEKERERKRRAVEEKIREKDAYLFFFLGLEIDMECNK